MTKCVILGTGPSLAKQRYRIIEAHIAKEVKVFGINNTFNDFPLDYWIACDPAWHRHYGQTKGSFRKFHWDRGICDQYGYEYIEGVWGDGLSMDPNRIHLGHSSGYQALNIAYHLGYRDIYLAGYDMRYSGPRHYFDDLSGDVGEYPSDIRKFSDFDKPRVKKGNPQAYSLFQCYETVAEQNPCNIYNMTKDSALRCFEFKDL